MQQPPPYPGEYNMVPKAPPMGQMPQPMLKLPVERECPICHKQGLTTVQCSIKLTGWLLILFLGICGLIACCQDGWKEFKHKCTYCGYSFGSYEPPLTTNEKMSLGAAVCCLVCLPIIFVIIYVLGVFAFVASSDYDYQG